MSSRYSMCPNCLARAVRMSGETCRTPGKQHTRIVIGSYCMECNTFDLNPNVSLGNIVVSPKTDYKISPPLQKKLQKKWEYIMDNRARSARIARGLSMSCQLCENPVHIGEHIYSRNASSRKSRSKIYHIKCAKQVNIV